MPRRSLPLRWLVGASFVLGCDQGPTPPDQTEPLANAPAVAVTAPESVVATPAGAAYRIAGPSEEGSLGDMAQAEDPSLTLFDPTAPRVVTLALVAPTSQRKGDPSMDLFGGADQPWRVQIGPRTDLGRKSGLMLRGGTTGQHNRWDIGASATVGDQSNVRGIVRFHP